jgi:hypothetical protein
MMQRIFIGLLAVLSLVGCESAKPLPYAAGEEGAAKYIRADFVQIGSKIQVVVDASAYKVKSAFIQRTNGQQIQPLAIQQPHSNSSDMSNIGSINGGYIGSGRRTSATIGVSNAGNAVQSKTYVWFDLLSLGDAPWTLKLDVQGIGELAIELPAKVTEADKDMQTPTPQPVN